MKGVMIVCLLIVVILFSGCIEIAEYSSGAEGSPKQQDLQNIPQNHDERLNCSSINSNPELWYLKSGDTFGYYTYISARDFSHPKYEIGKGQIVDEDNFNLNTNEKILRHGRYCSFGRKTGQNINHLYCKFEFLATELSEKGEILSKPKIMIDVIFLVDKSKERVDTEGGYLPVDEAKLISQTCYIE